MKAGLVLEIDEKALTEERKEAYRQQHDEDWEDEGYVVDGTVDVEEILVDDDMPEPEMMITVTNDELWLRLHIPLHVVLAEFLKHDDFRTILNILRRKKDEVDRLISDLKQLDLGIKEEIAKRLILDAIKGEKKGDV